MQDQEPHQGALCLSRSKARQFHPDVNKDPGAEQTFKDISNAYEVLQDDQKRGIYDKCGPVAELA